MLSEQITMRIKAPPDDVFAHIAEPAKVVLWRFAAREARALDDDDGKSAPRGYKITFGGGGVPHCVEIHRFDELQQDAGGKEGKAEKRVKIAVWNQGGKFTGRREEYLIKPLGKHAAVTCKRTQTPLSRLGAIRFKLFSFFVDRRDRKLFFLNARRLWTSLEARPPSARGRTD